MALRLPYGIAIEAPHRRAVEPGRQPVVFLPIAGFPS